MRVAPGAVVDDGLLDVVVVGAASRLALMRALPTIYDGSHVDRPEVTVRARQAGRAHRRSRRPPSAATASRSADLPGPDAAPAVVEVLPAALTVIA